MIYPANTDIIPLLRNTIKALIPYARANQAHLEYHSTIERQLFQHDPLELMQVLSRLICQVIHFLPAHHTIKISPRSTKTAFVIEVTNSGVDLSTIREITDHVKGRLRVTGTGSGTTFQYCLPLNGEVILHPEDTVPRSTAYEWRGLYAIVRKRLQSHFSKSENLVALLSHNHPKDAAFLERINGIIRMNLENETFDTSCLCREISMSRSKLFRKLKMLIRQAPAHYIRVMRLEKAKELLETTELNISEVTFKTGFQSQSHFTKAFIQQYGVCPSLFRRKMNGTK